jgi:hypothetical protein
MRLCQKKIAFSPFQAPWNSCVTPIKNASSVCPPVCSISDLRIADGIFLKFVVYLSVCFSNASNFMFLGAKVFRNKAFGCTQWSAERRLSILLGETVRCSQRCLIFQMYFFVSRHLETRFLSTKKCITCKKYM